MEQNSQRKKGHKWLTLLLTVLLIGGIYIVVTSLAPAIPVLDSRPPDATAQKLVTTKPGMEGNRLYIPQINVDVAIVEGGEEALEKGAWHRFSENGTPEKGGNFVLSAHRFLLGMTPGETRAKSPFYNIDKLQLGDILSVDYNGKRYEYEIVKRYKVERTAIEIEAPSEQHKLTLYTCDLRGENAGREVVEAKPLPYQGLT